MLTLPIAPRRPALYRQANLGVVTTFSGLIVVIALLLSLTWLPLAPEAEAEPGPRVARRIVAMERPPATPAGWLYTIHIVESEEQKRGLFARYPSPTSDSFIVIAPGQETDLQLFRAEIDAQRSAQGLPPAVIDDLRPRAP